MYIMIGKVILVIITILNVTYDTFAYSNMPLKMKMTMSNDIKNRTGKRSAIVDEIVQNAKICTKKTISVDTVILNIYKVNKFYFNSNSPIITLSLKDKMNNMYYINDDGESEKLTNTTKFFPNVLKNIFVYELDVDMDIDCILFKKP